MGVGNSNQGIPIISSNKFEKGKTNEQTTNMEEQKISYNRKLANRSFTKVCRDIPVGYLDLYSKKGKFVKLPQNPILITPKRENKGEVEEKGLLSQDPDKNEENNAPLYKKSMAIKFSPPKPNKIENRNHQLNEYMKINPMTQTYCKNAVIKRPKAIAFPKK